MTDRRRSKPAVDYALTALASLALEVGGVALLVSVAPDSSMSVFRGGWLVAAGSALLISSVSQRRALPAAALFVAAGVTSAALLIAGGWVSAASLDVLLFVLAAGAAGCAAFSLLPVRPVLQAPAGLALAAAPMLLIGDAPSSRPTAVSERRSSFESSIADAYESVLDAEAARSPHGAAAVRGEYTDFLLRQSTGPAPEAVRGAGAFTSVGAYSDLRVREIRYETAPAGDSVVVTVRVVADAGPRWWLAGLRPVARFADSVATARMEAIARANGARVSGTPALTADMRRLRALLDSARAVRTSHYETYWLGMTRTNEAPFVAFVVTSGKDATDFRSERGRASVDVFPFAASLARTVGWVRQPSDDDPTAPYRFEDVFGRCLTVARTAAGAWSPPQRCVPQLLAGRVPRATILAQTPLALGEWGARWSVNAVLRGTLRIFADSVTIRVDTLTLEGNDAAANRQRVDSVALGLARGASDGAWNVVSRASPLRPQLVVPFHRRWTHNLGRFTILVPPGTPLESHWPTLEVTLSERPSTDNPYGTAWTYSHAPQLLFQQVLERARPR